MAVERAQRRDGPTVDAERRKPRRAWILIPVVIIAIAVAGLIISSFQKEVGLASPGTSGRAAVAAAAGVERVLSADEGYPIFSTAFLAALTAHDNMVVANPADTRLDHLLTGVMDCYKALREAWQTDFDDNWEEDVQGETLFWNARHPFLDLEARHTLTLEDVIAHCRNQASMLLAQAVDLAN